MTRRTLRSTVAVVVAFALVGSAASLPAPAAGLALLQGRVLDADGKKPMSGVVVTLFDPTTQATFSSSPSDERGVFKASAPAGTYRLVAETGGGAFLAAGPVEMSEGKNPAVALTLQRQTGGTGDTASGTPDQQKKDELKPWVKWTIIGVIGVAAILAVDAASGDEGSASGF